MKAKTLPVVPAALRILPEIRQIIAGARKHVAIAANLTMVNLYSNIGQIITRDIRQNAKRAGYGDQLLNGLAQALTKEYGQGYSVSNLNDMRRFYDFFRILQTASVESLTTASRKTTSGRFSKTQTLQTLSVECSDRLPIDFQKALHAWLVSLSCASRPART